MTDDSLKSRIKSYAESLPSEFRKEFIQIITELTKPAKARKPTGAASKQASEKAKRVIGNPYTIWRIRMRNRKDNFSQRQIAKSMKISQATVSRIVRGEYGLGLCPPEEWGNLAPSEQEWYINKFGGMPGNESIESPGD